MLRIMAVTVFLLGLVAAGILAYHSGITPASVFWLAIGVIGASVLEYFHRRSEAP